MKRLTVAAALLALAASGCASTDAELHRALREERMETMTIVTRAELRAQPAGSPARALLALWRAVQFRDAEGALASVWPRPDPSELENFENFVVGGGADTASAIKPVIVRSDTTGGRSAVVVEFVRHRKVGDKVRTKVTGRLRVELMWRNGRWLVLWRKAATRLPQVIS